MKGGERGGQIDPPPRPEKKKLPSKSLALLGLKAWFCYLVLFIKVNILLFHWVYFTSFLDHFIELNVSFYSFTK